MYYYAFTLRPLKGTIEDKIESLMVHMQYLDTQYKHIDLTHHYEIVEKENGNHNVHVHGMIKTPRKLLKKMLHPGAGFHFWIDACKSELAWNVYITKQNFHPQELLHKYRSCMGPERSLGISEEESDIVTQSDDEDTNKLISKLGSRNITNI